MLPQAERWATRGLPVGEWAVDEIRGDRKILQDRIGRYGLGAGAILAAFVALMVPFCEAGEGSEIVGYSSMVLAFLLVFFGVRSYRDRVAHGTISFGKAFQVGLLMVLVACSMYVIAWEITYFNFMPDFIEKYNAHMIEKMRADGKPAAEIDAQSAKLAEFAKSYKNPLINSAVTFMEAFPVGLIMALISAAALRKKPQPAPEPALA